MKMVNRVENKIALVTGAASGIGAAIAKLFIDEGAVVIIADINDEKGNDLCKLLGKRAHYFHLDVCHETDWQNLYQYIEKQFNHLDILVNNAGITGLGLDLDSQSLGPEFSSLKSWHIIHSVNLDSVFLGCKYAIQLMKKQRMGTIVNIGSRSGLVGIPSLAAYASSKAAVRNHTKTVALYCAQQNYGIRCNCIHPAAILTPLWDTMFAPNLSKEQAIANLAQSIPLKRMGTPEDVAFAALYFASDESAYVTGTELIVDGGILAGASASPSK